MSCFDPENRLDSIYVDGLTTDNVPAADKGIEIPEIITAPAVKRLRIF
jgi:hypothetical protein